MDYQNIHIMCSIIEDYIYQTKSKVIKIDRRCFTSQIQYLLLCQAYQTVIANNKNEK